MKLLNCNQSPILFTIVSLFLKEITPLLAEVNICKFDEGEFLAWDGSCQLTCDPPLIQRSFAEVRLCDSPCPSGKSLNWDGSCTESCKFPWQAKIEAANILICESPCEDSSDYFDEKEQVCKSICEPTSSTREEGPLKICNPREKSTSIVLPSRNLEEVQELMASGGRIALEIMIVLISFIIGSNSTIFTLAGFVKMFQYFRYMNIGYSPRLESMFKNHDFPLGSFLFGPLVPTNIENSFPPIDSPDRFKLYNLNSRFLVNYWQTLTSLAISLIIVILIWILTHLTRNSPTINKIIKRIKVVIQWNLFLLIFCSNLDGIVLFTLIDRGYEMGSILISCLMNVITFLIFGILIYNIINLRRQRRLGTKEEDLEVKWEAFQFLFKGLKRDTALQQFFTPISLLRIYIFNIFIAYLPNHPLVQAPLILVMNLLMIAFILFKNPFDNKWIRFYHILNETLFFLASFSVLLLAIPISGEVETEATSTIVLGDMIMVINIGVIYFSMICLIVVMVIPQVIKSDTQRVNAKIYTKEACSSEMQQLKSNIGPPNNLPAPAKSERSSKDQTIPSKNQSLAELPNIIAAPEKVQKVEKNQAAPPENQFKLNHEVPRFSSTPEGLLAFNPPESKKIARDHLGRQLEKQSVNTLSSLENHHNSDQIPKISPISGESNRENQTNFRPNLKFRAEKRLISLNRLKEEM